MWRQEMKNPGIDLKIWKNLRRRWTELDATGHVLKVDFQLVGNPKRETDILAIDVVQHIDDEIITETVQRKAGEAYETLGITGLSAEELTKIYKEMLEKLYRQQAKPGDTALVVTMSPRSATSGEIRGYVQNLGVQSSVLLNYQHYYILNALREKMIETKGEAWSKVRAVYDGRSLEFYFDE
jgi:hypothetical protein